MGVLSTVEGYMLIGVFFAVMVAVVCIFQRRTQTKEEFLLANRKRGHTEC